MSRLRALCAIALMVVAPTVFATAAAGASAPAPTFTITPNPVEGGNEVTFSGTGCIRRETDPPGTPITVYLTETDDASVSGSAASARVMAKSMRTAMANASASGAADDDGPAVTPNADGTWSYTLPLPAFLAGTFHFGAVCDGYNWSFNYQPVTLTVTPNPAGALMILPDFLDQDSTPSLHTGVSYEVLGLGFVGSEKVQLDVHSAPVKLATFIAEDGFIDGFFTLPDTLASGAHTLTLRGLSSGITVSLDITAIAPPVPTASVTTVTVTATSPTSTPVATVSSSTAAGAGPVSSGPTLAATGTAAGQMLWFGLGLTVLGAATLMLTRRRAGRLH